MVLQTILTALSLIWYHNIFCGSLANPQPATHVISLFFISKSTGSIDSVPSDQLEDIIASPGSAERALLRQREVARSASGIYAMYAGRIEHSDSNGQLLLPLAEPADEITIVVTERPKPIIIHGNTIDHWEVAPGRPAEWFHLRRKKLGSQTIWQTRKIDQPSVMIPTYALIIRIDPEAIEIPEGTSPTEAGVNLILPNIYITGRRPEQPSALNTISTNKFFKPAHQSSAYAPERYVTVIT